MYKQRVLPTLDEGFPYAVELGHDTGSDHRGGGRPLSGNAPKRHLAYRHSPLISSTYSARKRGVAAFSPQGS